MDSSENLEKKNEIGSKTSLSNASSYLSEDRDGIRPLIDTRNKKKKKRKKKFTYSNPNNAPSSSTGSE